MQQYSYLSPASTQSFAYSTPTIFRIFSCAFLLLTSSSNGGALYISGPINLELSSSHFRNCSAPISSGEGGCICAAGMLSSVTDRCCAQGCYSGQWGMSFFYNGSSSSNHIISLLTIDNCPYSGLGLGYSIFFENGAFNVSQLNSSRSILSGPVTSYFIYTTMAHYSQFNNFVNGHASIVVELQTNCAFSLSNIINNTETASTYGMVYTSTITTVSSCIFSGISFTYCFKETSSNLLSIINCTMNSTPTISGNVVTSDFQIVANPSTFTNSQNPLGNCMASWTGTMSIRSDLPTLRALITLWFPLILV